VEDRDDIVCELVHVSLDWDGEGEGIEGRRMEAEAIKEFNTLSYTVWLFLF
jgi:hypothetical protein